MRALLAFALSLVLALPAHAGGALDSLLRTPPPSTTPNNGGITCPTCGARPTIVQWKYSNGVEPFSLPSSAGTGDTLIAGTIGGGVTCPGPAAGWTDFLNVNGVSGTYACVEMASHVVASGEANSYTPFVSASLVVCQALWIYEWSGFGGVESSTAGNAPPASPTVVISATTTHDNDAAMFYSGRTGCGGGNWSSVPSPWVDFTPALGTSNATAAIQLPSSIYPKGATITGTGATSGGSGYASGALAVFHP